MYVGEYMCIPWYVRVVWVCWSIFLLSGVCFFVFWYALYHAKSAFMGAFLEEYLFTESAHWADSVIELRCPSVCPSVCLSVCVCPLDVEFISRPLIGPQVT